MSMGVAGRKVMLISDQVMLKAANQVLFQTVRALLQDGYEVCLILDGNTGHEVKNIATLEELFPEYLNKLQVHYFVARFGWLFDFLGRCRKQLRKIRGSTTVSASGTVNFLPSNVIAGFDKTRTGVTWVSDFKYEMKWSAAYAVARRVARAFKPDLICGFEIGGAVPAEKLANKISIPFYTKYMGTIVHPYIQDDTLGKVRPYVKGLSVKAAIHFMLNDGTKGDDVLKYFGVDPSTIRFRIDGIDKDKFSNLPSRKECVDRLGLALDKDAFYCLCLSNHNAGYKRLDRAIRAVSQVSRKHPSIKLILVGNGANTENLKQLAKELGQTGNILFLPKLSHEQIPFILNIASVYLNTNDQSNLSHPVLEAMMCGTAVVSMDDGSLDGIIVNGESGVLVDPAQCETKLPQAIEELFLDPERLLLLSGCAKTFASKELYSWDEKNRIELEEINNLLMH